MPNVRPPLAVVDGAEPVHVMSARFPVVQQRPVPREAVRVPMQLVGGAVVDVSSPVVPTRDPVVVGAVPMDALVVMELHLAPLMHTVVFQVPVVVGVVQVPGIAVMFKVPPVLQMLRVAPFHVPFVVVPRDPMVMSPVPMPPLVGVV